MAKFTFSQVQATLGITSDEMSTLNGESVNTMDSLSALAKQMGTERSHSASSCAEAINYLALAGYDTQQIFDTLPMVLSLASVGGLELAKDTDFGGTTDGGSSSRADLSSITAAITTAMEKWGGHCDSCIFGRNFD